jgi:hypothetical protein
MRKLFSSFAVKVQVSDVTTGLIIVLYILILVLLFRNFEFNSSNDSSPKYRNAFCYTKCVFSEDILENAHFLLTCGGS